MLKDTGLIVGLKCGDAQALRQVYQRYKDDLLSVASSLLGSSSQAKNVLGEVFVSFAGAVPGLGLGVDLRSDLTACVVSIVQDSLRDTIYQVTELDIGKYQGQTSQLGEQLPPPEQMAERLRAALAAVPLQQREVITLYLQGGLSFEEIASLQGVSAGTVRGRYRYGIEKLKSLPGGAIEAILMAPADRLEEAIRKLRETTSPDTDELIITEALAALAQSTQANPPSGLLSLCEAISKSKVAPAAAAAAILLAAVLAGVIAFFVLPPRAPAPIVTEQVTRPMPAAVEPAQPADVNTAGVVGAEKPRTVESDIKGTVAKQESFELVVINRETLSTIEGASVDFVIEGKEQRRQTDVEGLCIIELGQKPPDYLTLLVRKEGFVPVLISYPYKDARPVEGKGYMLLLEPGQTIGGTIIDEESTPIQGVTVSLVIKAVQGTERAAIIDYPVKTDAEGKWRCDIAPWNFEYIGARLSHPAYLDDQTYRTVTEDIEKLRDMTAVMVLEKGALVTGVVIDAANQPIVGAVVCIGADPLEQGYTQVSTSDNGWFEFDNIPLAETVLTVTAQGFSPDLTNLAVSKETPPIEFILEPAHSISGKVIDPQGKPIEGVLVEAVQWREHKSLQWHAYSDSRGLFEWTDAPADKVLFDISKAGYAGIRGQGLLARQVPYEIILYPPLRNP